MNNQRGLLGAGGDSMPSTEPVRKGTVIALTKIELHRAEGPSEKCGPAGPFTTWADADGQLFRWAENAPEPGHGYHKVDFTVTWADGETYAGRYDMNRWGEDSDRDGHSIARHIRTLMNFYAHQPQCPGFFKTGPEDGSDKRAKDAAKSRDIYLPEELYPALNRFWCCEWRSYKATIP